MFLTSAPVCAFQIFTRPASDPVTMKVPLVQKGTLVGPPISEHTCQPTLTLESLARKGMCKEQCKIISHNVSIE